MIRAGVRQSRGARQGARQLVTPLLLQARGLVPGLAGQIGGEQGIELIPARQQRLFVIPVAAAVCGSPDRAGLPACGKGHRPAARHRPARHCEPPGCARPVSARSGCNCARSAPGRGRPAARPREGGNRLGQLLLARQIQVVGGFVEPEHVVAAEGQGEKQQPCPLAPAQGVHLLAVAGQGKPARISACRRVTSGRGARGTARRSGWRRQPAAAGTDRNRRCWRRGGSTSPPADSGQSVRASTGAAGRTCRCRWHRAGQPCPRSQPEPLGTQQRRQCRCRRYVEGLQSQQGVGRQAHSAQLEPPGASAATWLCSSCRRAMRFSMDLAWRTSFSLSCSRPQMARRLLLALRRSISFAHPPGAGGPAHPRQPAPPGLAAGQGEAVQLAISQDQGLIRDAVQQASVVGDQHEGAAPAQQKLLEPEQGGQVQVVAGLIEQQQVGLAQQGAPLSAAGCAGHRSVH